MYNKYTGDKNHLPLADTFLLKVYCVGVHPHNTWHVLRALFPAVD